ncbi:hypothetical protein GZL_00433 [Streptomyces sp. 769]|nr:hypothetical protein GZL_00433 [Streptomyces sp. 769]
MGEFFRRKRLPGLSSEVVGGQVAIDDQAASRHRRVRCAPRGRCAGGRGSSGEVC